MKLTVDMPWERNLSVNSSHFGPGGKYRRKPNVQAWMRSLHWTVKSRISLEQLAEMRLPVRVLVDFRYPDKHTRDSHNYFAVICNAVADGLGIDDSHIRISTGSVIVDKANPGFTIRIEDGE